MIRRLAKDILIYGSGDLLLKAAAVITMPIMTRIFDTTDYGILNFMTTVSSMVLIAIGLGGDSAYARYYFRCQTMRERQVLTSTWFGFLALWSALVVSLLIVAADWLSEISFDTPEHAFLFALALLAAPVTLMHALAGQVIRNEFRPVLWTCLNASTVGSGIVIGLTGAIAFDLGLAAILGGILAGGLIMLPVRIWTIRAWLRPVFSLRVLVDCLRFGLPLVPAALAYWIFQLSDRIMLSQLSTLDELGLYAVAASIVGVMALSVQALGQAWSPHAVRAYEADPEGARSFFGQVFTYILAGFGAACVALTALSPELLVVLATPAFYGAALAIGPLALGYVAYATTQVTAAGISLRMKTGYISLYSWLAAALNVALNLVLIPLWGMMGAAAATAVTFVFLTCAYLMTSQRLWRVAYEVRRALPIAALTLAFTAGAMVLPDGSLLIAVPIKLAYCASFAAALFLFGGLGRREWAAIRGLAGPRRARSGAGVG